MFFGGDPFEHFGHGGGGGRSHRASRGGGGGVAADTTKLYETLGVSFGKLIACRHFSVQYLMKGFYCISYL